MSEPTGMRRVILYEMLKEQFKILRATFNPHLDVAFLADMRIEVSFIDLHQETQDGGAYYLPMLQSRLDSLDQRPEFRISFSMDDFQWNYSDGVILCGAFSQQLLGIHAETLSRAIEKTKWRKKWSVPPATGCLRNQLI